MKSHIYHLVNPSPWPLILSILSLSLMINLILYMYLYSSFIKVLIFLILVLYGIKCWFGDIIREGSYEGVHTSKVQAGLKYGMILFIISEVMFFVSFFWAYFDFSLSPPLELGCSWPPYGIQTFNYTDIPLYNTLILLLSGACITWTHNEILESKLKNKINVILSLILTILLAIYFTIGQIMEYKEASFSIEDGVYGSTFYLATGFHGFHVVLGTIFLIICLLRLKNNHLMRDHHLGLEFAIWYWHFVDVVWLFLFISIYWLGSC